MKITASNLIRSAGLSAMVAGLIFSVVGLIHPPQIVASAFALLPQSFAPLAAVPVGLGLAWLGYALWSERRGQASQPVPATKRALLSPTPAK